MNQFRNDPSPVSLSADSSIRRLGEMVQSTIRRLMAANVFSPRATIDPMLVNASPTGPALNLRWGSLNRVVLGYTGLSAVQLPAIRPEWIGQELLISQLRVATGAGMRIFPGGKNVQGGTPLVNGFSGINASGFRRAITDGVNWEVY